MVAEFARIQFVAVGLKSGELSYDATGQSASLIDVHELVRVHQGVAEVDDRGG